MRERGGGGGGGGSRASISSFTGSERIQSRQEKNDVRGNRSLHVWFPNTAVLLKEILELLRRTLVAQKHKKKKVHFTINLKNKKYFFKK